MSDSTITSIATTLNTFGILDLAVFTYFANERSRRNSIQLEKVEKNTNSLKDALVKVTGESEFAKGVIEGKEQNKGDAQ